MQDGKLSINVHICGRNFALKIDPVHEERVRQAAKTVNEKVRDFREKFQDNDDQDFLSMAALGATIELLEAKESKDESHLMATVNEQIVRIDQELAE